MPKLWKDVLETYGLNLWQRENENSLICQNFQTEAAHNSTEVKTETGSSTAEPGRGKEMGHLFPASHFQLVLFSNKELKIKICFGLQEATTFSQFSRSQFARWYEATGRIDLFTFGKINSSKIAVDRIYTWHSWGASFKHQGGIRNSPRLCWCHWGFSLGSERGMNDVRIPRLPTSSRSP